MNDIKNSFTKNQYFGNVRRDSFCRYSLFCCCFAFYQRLEQRSGFLKEFFCMEIPVNSSHFVRIWNKRREKTLVRAPSFLPMERAQKLRRLFSPQMLSSNSGDVLKRKAEKANIYMDLAEWDWTPETTLKFFKAFWSPHVVLPKKRLYSILLSRMKFVGAKTAESKSASTF